MYLPSACLSCNIGFTSATGSSFALTPIFGRTLYDSLTPRPHLESHDLSHLYVVARSLTVASSFASMNNFSFVPRGIRNDHERERDTAVLVVDLTWDPPDGRVPNSGPPNRTSAYTKTFASASAPAEAMYGFEGWKATSKMLSSNFFRCAVISCTHVFVSRFHRRTLQS